MTYREHRAQVQAEIQRLVLRSDRAYFECVMEGRKMKDAIRLSGLHKSWFYRRMKATGVPVRHQNGNRGNSAWQALGDHQ